MRFLAIYIVANVIGRVLSEKEKNLLQFSRSFAPFSDFEMSGIFLPRVY